MQSSASEKGKTSPVTGILQPPKSTPKSCTVIRWSLIPLLVGAFCLVLHSNLHTSKPDEWLLVVKNGKMVRAGVGITHFASIGEQVSIFPSSLQKVPFTAMQVTQERQGVEVSGFAVWVVNRDQDGPFKAYKHLGGMDQQGLETANGNLADMAESIIRAQVAKMPIVEVITNRTIIRDAVRESMQSVVKGWGVWLETVEVTEVRVLSSSLFENFQAPYRQISRLEAERARLEAQEQINALQVETDLKASNAREQARQDASLFASSKELDVSRETAAMQEEKDDLALKAMTREFALKRQRLEEEEDLRKLQHMLDAASEERQHALEIERTRHQVRIATELASAERERVQLQAALELKQLNERFAVEATMSAVNMQKARIDALRDIYSALPIRDVRLVSFGASAQSGGRNGTATSGSLESLLPGLVGMLEGAGHTSK